MSTITNYNASAVPDDGTESEANKIKFRTVETSLTGPIKTFVEANLEKANFSATSAPTTTDDSGDAYGVGTIWIDVSGDKAYICVDASSGAAVWKEIGSSGFNNNAGTAAPTTTDDTGDGYGVGSFWFDVTNDVPYVCLDASSGAAVWRRFGIYDWELIANGTGSGASLDITDLSTTYRAYKLVYSDLKPANDGSSLQVRLSTDNGVSFQSGGTEYEWAYHTVNSAGTPSDVGDNADSDINIGGAIGNDTNEEAIGEILIIAPAQTDAMTTVIFNQVRENASGVFIYDNGGGRFLSEEATDAIQLILSGGNITRIDYTLYGMRAA